MAERRMFSKKIIDSDAFMDMPLSTQALYFHLSMRADDDGFINNPKKIQRMVGASDDDLKVLIAKRFILTFESGIIVVKHWRMHNYIRCDRYKPTDYIEEKSRLELKENGSYTEADTNGIPNGYRLDTQDRLELGESKDSVGEDSVVDVSPTPSPKPVRHKYGMYKNVLLTDEDYQKLQTEFPHDYSERIDRLSEYIESTGKKYKSHLATIRAWARKDTTQKKGNSSNPFLDMLNEGE
jgi:hypothetical protein